MSLSWYSEYVGSGAGIMFHILLLRFSVSIPSVSFSNLGEEEFLIPLFFMPLNNTNKSIKEFIRISVTNMLSTFFDIFMCMLNAEEQPSLWVTESKKNVEEKGCLIYCVSIANQIFCDN
uniref:Uncharacterized protein MANES_12G003500 n=1 Tax=Rhizophora mucronata TaxID=61149 RepID=A0A2P2LVC5_RHIMU